MFKQAIRRRYLDNNAEFIKECHMQVYLALEKTPNSIRKFEEQTNQLYRAKDYFMLKQAVSSIETFL